MGFLPLLPGAARFPPEPLGLGLNTAAFCRVGKKRSAEAGRLRCHGVTGRSPSFLRPARATPALPNAPRSTCFPLLSLVCRGKGSPPPSRGPFHHPLLPGSTGVWSVFSCNIGFSPDHLGPKLEKQTQRFRERSRCKSTRSAHPESAHEGNLRKLTGLTCSRIVRSLLIQSSLISLALLQAAKQDPTRSISLVGTPPSARPDLALGSALRRGACWAEGRARRWEPPGGRDKDPPLTCSSTSGGLKSRLLRVTSLREDTESLVSTAAVASSGDASDASQRPTRCSQVL